MSNSRSTPQETISTCKFAQRVAMIDTDAVINEEIDPQIEIAYLKNEVEELRKQLTLKVIRITAVPNLDTSAKINYVGKRGKF